MIISARSPTIRRSRRLPEASPRGFLEVLGILSPDEPAEVELLPQELSVPTVSLDVGLLVHAEEPFVAVFEAFGRFRRRSLEQMLDYGKGLDAKTHWPIRAYMVPLVERGCPRHPPTEAVRVKGDFRVEIALRWIRPWRIDAGKLLAQGRPEFDAWTPLFRCTPEQQDEAVSRLRQAPNQLARYRILGGLRYRGREAAFWEAFVERMNRMLTKEDLRQSRAVQEWLEEGRIEGRLEGRVEGHRDAGERWLRRALARFPGVALPAILPASLDLLDLAEAVMAAPDEAAVRALLSSKGLLS